MLFLSTALVIHIHFNLEHFPPHPFTTKANTDGTHGTHLGAYQAYPNFLFNLGY